MRISLELPYPPSINHYYRRVGARTIISKEGREYRAKICIQLGQPVPLAGPLGMRIDVYPPDRRRRDVDNIQKPVLDALQHTGIYGDDSQVKDLRTVMHKKQKPGYLLITLWTLTPRPTRSIDEQIMDAKEVLRERETTCQRQPL